MTDPRTEKENQYIRAKTEEVNSVKDTMAITFVTLSEQGTIDTVTAAEHSELFSPWKAGVSYKQGNIRSYNNKLYKCLQDHVALEDWSPDVTASLWKVIGDPIVEYPDWSQPIAAGDAYNTGDKVLHNAKHWISIVDNNVWEPGVYGWKEA